MIFATDLDGCLLNMWDVFAEEYSILTGLDISPDFAYYDITWSLGTDPAMENILWPRVWAKRLGAYAGAKQFLRCLQFLGIDVHVVSYRGSKESKKAAYDDISREFGDLVTDIHLLDMKSSYKSTKLNKLGASFMLEDHIGHAIECLNYTKGIKEVYLMNRSTNNQCLDLSPYKRVFGYGDILADISSNYVYKE